MYTDMDWKDKLGAAFGVSVPTSPAAENECMEQQPQPKRDALSQQGNEVVHVLIERKGRAGKVATLVVDLRCDDVTLKALARELKQQLGVGGSARAGEILIQGDHRERVMQLLRDKGFKVK